MKKIKKLIIGGILSLILTLSCLLTPKADINSVGSSLLNDNNIAYAFTLDESSPSAFITELTSGVGLYLNYIDYLNFYGYARQLTYNSNNYYLFDYLIYDSSLNDWQITGIINRTQNSQNDYDYSLNFVYDLPTLGQGNETLINTNGINTDSNLYGLVSDFVSTNNVEFQNANIFKLVAARLFSTTQGSTYNVDVEFTPTNTSSLGTDNNIIKNFVSSQPFTQKKPNNSNIIYTNEWEPMTWNGYTSFSGSRIWTNGTDYFYSDDRNQYKLNGTTWEPMTWSGLTSFYGNYVWTNRTGYFYSYGTNQYKLNGTTWEPMTWSGYTNINGTSIWTNGTDYFYSSGTNQYKLNGTTWEPMTWSGLTSFYKSYVWTNGNDIFYSNGSAQYKLNGTTWELMTWSGLTSFMGSYVWTNGTDYFYSFQSEQYKLNGTTWEPMTWSGLTSFMGSGVWTNGNDIFYSNNNAQYKLVYEEIPQNPTYTAQLNYYGNGGFLGENSSATYTGYIDNLESSSLTLTQEDVNNIFFNETEPDLRNGYKFIGWGLSPEDREPFSTVNLDYDGQYRLTGNFYAIWELDDEIPVNLKLTISNNGIRTEIYNSVIFLQNINGYGGLSNLYFNKNGTFFKFNIGASLRKISNILNYDYINYVSYYFNEETSQGYTDFTSNIISSTVNDVIINIYNVNSNGQIINKYYEASDNNEWDEENLFSVTVDNIQPEGEINIVIYINADLPSEETNFKTWVSSIAEIFSIILAINIGFITLGQFVFLVLAIFVIIFIIRMVRGGKGG